MLHVLSATTFDPDGYIEIDAVPDQSAGEARRRVTRISTLDGGAVFNDFGFSDADRTIELRWEPRSQAQEAAIQLLVRSYSLLQISTRDGVFLAAPEVYAPGPPESRLRLLVSEKLSE